MPAPYLATAVGLPLLSSVLKGVGLALGGNQEKERDYREAAIMDQNALELDKSVADAIYRGYWESNQISAGGALLDSSFRTSLAGGGLVMDSGAPADVLERTDLLSELDAKMALRNARNTARGIANQADVLRKGANNLRESGRSAQKTAIWGAGSTILMGGLSAVDTYNTLKTPKVA